MKVSKVGGNMKIILVYDIAIEENGSKSWRNIFKVCNRYLSHIQNSVFEGELSNSQLMSLKTEISVHCRDDLDSIIIFQIENAKWIKKEFIGLVDDKTSNFF